MPRRDLVLSERLSRDLGQGAGEHGRFARGEGETALRNLAVVE